MVETLRYKIAPGEYLVIFYEERDGKFYCWQNDIDLGEMEGSGETLQLALRNMVENKYPNAYKRN